MRDCGPSTSLPKTPMELFSLFSTSNVMQHVVTEPNRYASQCLQGTDKQWATNEREIRAYLGFCVLMGIIREPEIRDYWSKSSLIHYSPIASCISRQRFEEIASYLHFVNNSTLPNRGQPGFHLLQKAKELLDMVRTQFSAVYNPSSCLSVDEAMIPYKGKLIHEHVCVHTCMYMYMYVNTYIYTLNITCYNYVCECK